MISKLATTAALAAVFFCSPASAQEPLAIAKQGYFFVGGKYAPVGDKQVMTGQIYVEYQVPRKRTQPYPLVIVPGAAQTATNFNGTTDGREGWTQLFLRRGYAVYIVEQPGRGRSSYQPDTEGAQAYPQVLAVQQRFTAPEKYNLWPQARLHTQWHRRRRRSELRPVLCVPGAVRAEAGRDPGAQSRCAGGAHR
jgi:pimeloyl-ACP methyl ester carboxylesterase